MYGKFTSELRDFARTETLKMRRERAERRLEEQKPQSSNGGTVVCGLSRVLTDCTIALLLIILVAHR